MQSLSGQGGLSYWVQTGVVQLRDASLITGVCKVQSLHLREPLLHVCCLEVPCLDVSRCDGRRGGCCLLKRCCHQHQILNVNDTILVHIGRNVFSCLSELCGDER